MKTFEKGGWVSEKWGCEAIVVERRGGGKGGKAKGKKGSERGECWIVRGSEDGRILGWDVQSREVVLDLKAFNGGLSSPWDPCLPPCLSPHPIDG